jgi:hypothetical protein
VLIGSLGIRLFMWLGPTIPLPPPPGVMASLTEVSVTNDADADDGFSLTLQVGRNSLLDYSLVSDGTFDPPTRVVIGVFMGLSLPEVLIDGIVTLSQLQPSNEPGQSTLTIMGKGLTQVLDLDERNDKYENQPDFLIFTRLVAQYAQYGLVPQPTPTTDVPIMLQRIPRQHETDLQFIRRLAARNGFVFYIEPVTLGVNRAYFGPEIRTTAPQSALTLNMGFRTNIDSLHFSNDSLAPVGTRGTFVDPIFKLPIPIPSLPSLRIPPLSRSPAPAQRTVQLRESSNENPAQAATTAVATVSRAPEAVTATGEVDSVRYGSVLRARKLVGVRGAGTSYDGFYFVRSVTHTLRPLDGEYRQSFTLSRDGTGALLPVVAP